MRLATLILAALLALIQYPLWLGKGGLLKVWEMERQLEAQRADNAKLRRRNAQLQAEVNDLQQGRVAVEERARYELGMLRDGELFVQYADAPDDTPGASTAGAPRASAGTPPVPEAARAVR